MSGEFFSHDERLQSDLDQRLDTVTAPDYQDPARKDLNLADYVGIAVYVIAAIVLSIWWGY